MITNIQNLGIFDVICKDLVKLNALDNFLQSIANLFEPKMNRIIFIELGPFIQAKLLESGL